MSYQANNLSILAYANNFTLWHYTTKDKFQDVCDAGYFNKAFEMVRVGDMIIVNTANTNTVVWVVLSDGENVKVS